MKLLILITLFAFIMVIYLLIKGSKDSEPPNGTVITYPDEIDKAIATTVLRKKLKKIERKRK